jgi:hypothetical protein
LPDGEMRMLRLRPIVRRVLVPPSSALATDDPTRVPFWRRPVSTFGRLPMTDLDDGRSLAFSLPSSARPLPDWCFQMGAVVRSFARRIAPPHVRVAALGWTRFPHGTLLNRTLRAPGTVWVPMTLRSHAIGPPPEPPQERPGAHPRRKHPPDPGRRSRYQGVGAAKRQPIRHCGRARDQGPYCAPGR